jgi:AcrR family transcriptional regulator
MKSIERREKAKENLRQEIMDAARELFVSEGYANVSMRRIADRIGYTPTTIYLYFEDKADLLNQLCEATFAQLTFNLIAISKLSASPLERLRLGLHEYIQFGLQHPNHYSIVFNAPLPHDPEYKFEESQGKEAFDTLRNSVAACLADGSIKKADAEVVSQTLWTGIHGVTSLLITQTGFPFVKQDKLIESVLDTLIAGIRA